MNTIKTISTTILLTSLLGSINAYAQQAPTFEYNRSRSCSADYAGLWLISKTCDLGSATDLKVDDAIDINCDGNTGRWSIDFYQEPTESEGTASHAVKHPICPSNGYITRTTEGHEILKCNFWESTDNVAKQLEFQLNPTANHNARTVTWLARETDNPDLVCNFAGRPEGGDNTGSAGNSVTSG